MTHRTHKVGEKSFTEEVLPVESVEEYFEHFSILEIDYTFYGLLLDKGGKPTPNYFTPKIIVEGIKCRKRINLITNNRAGAMLLRSPNKLLRSCEKHKYIEDSIEGANNLA